MLSMRSRFSIALVCFMSFCGIWRTSVSAVDDCSFSSLNFCLTCFTENQVDVYHLDDDVPFWNDTYEQLNARCLAHRHFSNCMEMVTPHCNRTMQLALKGLDNAYEFLCTSDGMRDYISNRSQCFARPNIKELVQICNRTYNTRLSTITSGTSNSASLYCRYVDDYIDCLNAGIASTCGEKAAKWQSDWIRNLRLPSMELNRCPGWIADEETDNAWATALLVALALTTTLMIVGIITLIIFIIRKRMYRERFRRSLGGINPDTDASPLPPPYSIVVETPGPDGQMQAHLVDSLSPSSPDGTAPRTLPGTSSLPIKAPILPPPYYDRPEESAPPYYLATVEATGHINEGYLEGEVWKIPEENQQGLPQPQTGDQTSEA